MNTLLWVLQLVLALAFLAHGLMFLFPPVGANLVIHHIRRNSEGRDKL